MFAKNRRDTKTSHCNAIQPLLVAWILLLGNTGCDRGNGSLDAGKVPATPDETAVTQITGYVGGEKMHFLQNEQIQRILRQKYQMAINPTKAGSVEMVSGLDPEGKDFLWPSNDIAVEFFRMDGGKVRKREIIFNSPIVVYTGWNITNALLKEGFVEKRAEGFFIVRFREMLTMILDQKAWKDVGLNFYGKITVRCTDPTKSNSGNMFAGLVANMLNQGEVVDAQSVERVLPELKVFFARLGMMEHSSKDLFQKFIATGTNNSMVVGYENQIIEFILENPQSRDLIQNSVCVLYPEPTVWSSHPVITLTEKGDRLIDALMDEEIQQLAWSQHGFRSGLVGVTIDPTAVNMPFMPETIDSVIPLPASEAMREIVEALESR